MLPASGANICNSRKVSPKHIQIWRAIGRAEVRKVIVWCAILLAFQESD